MAVVLAVALAFIGMRPTHAAETGPAPAAASNPTGDTKPGTGNTEAEPSPAQPVESSPVQLQLQDDALPPPDSDGAPLVRRRQSSLDATDGPPFWKTWVFWAVTGALVVGAVSLVAYTASKTESSLAPCPPDIVGSLGCYGAGR